MSREFVWLVDEERMSDEQVRTMADAVKVHLYDHRTLRGCLCELVVAGHTVRLSVAEKEEPQETIDRLRFEVKVLTHQLNDAKTELDGAHLAPSVEVDKNAESTGPRYSAGFHGATFPPGKRS